MAAICVSIRPYFLLTSISLGLWITIRKFIFEKYNYKIKLQKIIKFSTFWVFATLSLVAFLNFFPYLITNNLGVLISTIKINSVEYVSNPFQTFESQLFFFKTNPIITFSYSFLIIIFIFRIIFGKVLKKIFEDKTSNLLKFDIDLIFIGIIFPLLIEITILSRHFFFHYMTFFAGYASICVGLFLGLFMQIFRNKIMKNFNYIIIFFIGLIMSRNIMMPRSFTNNLDKIRDIDLPVIEKFIKKERALNRNIKFLFPLNNYFHWKLSESRHGFPLAAVYRNISQGKLDKILKKFPNLKYNYVMTKSTNLCNVLISKGPDLIFAKYKDKDGTFTYDCLQKSDLYIIDKTDSSLEDINWYVFRSNKR